MRACHAAGVPFMARGSGTSLSGGAVPIEDGIVIALNRLNRILRFDPESRIAVVEPGVVNLAVTALGAPHGLYYAPDPSSQSVCTIGGNVAFNSGGAHCFRHGMTANHVLGIEAVLADGTVVTLGGDSLEQAGPDLAGLFVGSEGLFGIALEITLRLVPRPAGVSHGARGVRVAAGRRRRRVARDPIGPAARRDGDHGPPGHRGGRSRRAARTIRPTPRRCSSSSSRARTRRWRSSSTI